MAKSKYLPKGKFDVIAPTGKVYECHAFALFEGYVETRGGRKPVATNDPSRYRYHVWVDGNRVDVQRVSKGIYRTDDGEEYVSDEPAAL